MRFFIASCVIAALGTILIQVGLNFAHDGYFPSIAIIGFFMIPLGFVGMVFSALASVYDISTRTQHELAVDAGCSDKDIVVMTPRAADLANLTVKQRGYPKDAAVRVVLAADDIAGFDIRYDLVCADERDWIGNSCGITILVAKSIISQIEGLIVDAADGAYVFKRVEPNP
jgi:hypothetical protein